MTEIDLDSEWDVVICGAGPAGCALALTLDQKTSVLVLEKAQKADLGFDWVDAFQIKLLEGSPLVNYVENIGGPHSAVFCSPNGRTKMNSPAIEGSIDVDRKSLALSLVSALELAENVGIVFGAKVIKPIIEKDSVKGVIFKQEQDEKSIYSKLLVDATGYSAVLRMELVPKFSLLADLETANTFLGYKKYIKNSLNEDQRENKIYFGRHHGIQWINSFPEAYIELFTGVANFDGHPSPKNLIPELEAELRERFGDSLDLTTIRADCGAPIPTRRCLDSFCEDGFLLVGDSACQCEPTTGSGVASGMLAGEIAGKVVNSLFSEGLPFTKENLWPYAKEWIEKIGADYASLDLFRLYLLGLPTDDLNFIFNNKIIMETDLAQVLGGGNVKIGVISLIMRILRGLTRLNLLLDLNQAITDAQKAKNIYLEYPSRWDPEEFQNWVSKNNYLFKKYQKKLVKIRY